MADTYDRQLRIGGDNVVGAVRAGGVVVTAGMQRPPIWMGPLAAVAVERRGLGAVHIVSGRVA